MHADLKRALELKSRLDNLHKASQLKEMEMVVRTGERGGAIAFYHDQDVVEPLNLIDISEENLDWVAQIKGERIEVRFFNQDDHEPGPDPETDWMTLNELLEQVENWIDEAESKA